MLKVKALLQREYFTIFKQAGDKLKFYVRVCVCVCAKSNMQIIKNEISI